MKSRWFLSLITTVFLLGCLQVDSKESVQAIDKLQKLTRAEWKVILDWNQDCDHVQEDWVTVYPLSTDLSLVEVVCTLGSYQGYQHYYVVDLELNVRGAQAIKLSVPADNITDGLVKANETDEIWGYPEFDLENLRLTMTRRFRGIGDCGVQTTYQFSEQGDANINSVRFQPCAENVKEKDFVPPNEWPQVKVQDGL